MHLKMNPTINKKICLVELTIIIDMSSNIAVFAYLA